ncbi:Prenyl cysteine carboxyl methyltransferase Ste14 [Penicillium digitatum]|uniref:Protein-S-isoprenylcysteine O-methyltransferase n=3 Tax=Penicillium digitatum TaxID=36651 RepID=K9FY61_PEND2|nr:Prenyl cysteine carboxyl methyltransferase Ste14 [Penicillium digitatum Pd1]EKV05135.1 Prenyl cysteine carboxyl methyltransferase Ste14 [Penicillium digitatum Pd1]EKV13452.1 Prenyl cysteine carboxyl methyltransferase Ste14 [Penicillium digitatum PHI26]QQK40127.1 Prenyl cysteine carboxyl methyltransferase Ste14 [Penicillium digitatum]
MYPNASGAEPNTAPNFTHVSKHISSPRHPTHDRTNSNLSSSSDASNIAPGPDTSIYPDGKMSLAGISLRAMLLGTSLGLSASMALFLSTVYQTTLWRIPFFVASLSLFHFLEFYVTARYNTRYATVSAFLLSSNGWAYNMAHGSAIVECLVSHIFWPGQTAAGRWVTVTEPFFGSLVSLLLVAGFVLLLIGQVVRTIAMAQAASNFNHHVQSQHQEGHVLVNSGLYRYLRHPSYFGFFWWGLGTQLVLGNMICFVGYALVLWQFFSSRIKREEAYLVSFFGDEYVQYRKATPVGIPGI